jgi:branched-chain amino acid aminotransferase
MTAKASIDGEMFDLADARVPVTDRGFLFGDSVFETLRAYGGRCFRMGDHLERLARSAASIRLELPAQRHELRRRVEDTILAAGERSAAVRLMVTRGGGPLEPDPSMATQPRVVVIARPRPRHPERSYSEGVSAVVVRSVVSASGPHAKTGNYLASVLAMKEARDAGAFEGILINCIGCVTEAASSNVFAVARGTVRTPPVDDGLLAGITRGVVLSLCSSLGLPFEEATLKPADLASADELLLTSTLKEVMPITRLGGAAVGDGRVGPVARRLLAAYREAVAADTGASAQEIAL